MEQDHAVAALAARQFGLVEREQVLAAGMTARMIHRRLAASQWIRVLPSVYQLSGSPKSWEQKLMALHLWAKPSAISHRAAAALHELRGIEKGRLELTTPSPRKPPWPNVSLHVQPFAAGDCENFGGFLITSPTRTIVDLAAVLNPFLLEQALDDALRRGLTTTKRIQTLLGPDRKGRRGLAHLRSMLSEREGGFLTDSRLESMVASLLTKAGVRPVHQFPLVLNGRNCRLDLAYPRHKLAIECQGYAHHSARQDWEKDQARQNALTLLGWRTLVVTWRQYQSDPSAIVDRVRAALVEIEDKYRIGT